MINKVVVVTGGNNGIGYYMVKELLTKDYKVAVLDISGEKLTNIDSNNLLFIQCDLRKDDEIHKAIKEIINQWEYIDILVNNACKATFKSFEEFSIEELKDELDVNYFGCVRTIREVYPYMKKRKKGIIHNVSSGVGVMGYPMLIGYTSSKGAIEALTKTLRLEFKKDNIIVNLFHPPLTDTKSSKPLGIPKQMMADAEKVGKGFANKIEKTKKIIAPDFITQLSIKATYKMPYKMGEFLYKMQEKENSKIDRDDM